MRLELAAFDEFEAVLNERVDARTEVGEPFVVRLSA
jgi:hypothetical protein